MPQQFVHLHVHSHYSLLDGLSRVDEIVARAKELGMPAVALTDHGVTYGLVEFYQHCKKAGLKPILGVEAYVADGSRHDRGGRDDRPYHLVLLAKTTEGYHNLLKLTTIAHLEGYHYKPRVDWEALAQHSGGLIALSACRQGEIPRALARGDHARARQAIARAVQTFGEGGFFLELQHHPSSPEQLELNHQLAQLSRELGVPLVATNDSHYLRPDDAEAQDVLLCIQTKSLLAETKRMSYRGYDLSLRTAEEMAEAFRDVPEAIANTVRIAEACDVELPLGRITLPRYDLPDGHSADDELARLAQAGLAKRYPGRADDPAVRERLSYELEVIRKTGFATYFLIVQDFVNWAKGRGILVGPGRGSAAGSLVSYLCGITNLDPIRYELMFERFLNPDRISMPDIDLDFADIRREEVLGYVAGKYGHDKVCQIITFGTMAARAAIRDVGRVLGFSYGYCDRLAKLVPAFSSLQQALEDVPELKQAYDQDGEAQRLIDLAKRLEGVARHSSTHACGVLITPERLDTYTAIQRASSADETIVSQYSLHPVEDLGLLKMDFLGLSNLTIIETALKIISKTTPDQLDLDQLPLDDVPTYELFQRGDTVGVFQFESSGMRRYLRQLRPTVFEDIIAMVALYRPGPMELIPQFIGRKQGRELITYLHPKLETILEKTYGIAVYQEQVLQIARQLAGFTYGEADVLRKAVGKKIKSLLDEQGDKLVSGMVKNGIDRKTAERIWEFIIPFARYGFNRAHAACYATIAYQTAYLKAHYPAQFMAALLASDQAHVDRIAIDVAECRRLGLQVLPPDVNESFPSFAVVPPATPGQPASMVRFGLGAVKNVGAAVAEAIVEERKANGAYASLADFLERVRAQALNRKALECLIRAGALDRFGERGQLLANVERLAELNRRASHGAATGQGGLFDSSGGLGSTLSLAAADPATADDKLAWEKELLGLYVSSHPLAGTAGRLGPSVPIAELGEHLSQIVRVVTVVNTVKRIITKAKQSMVAATVEDEFGSSCEAVVFPKALEGSYALWRPEARLVISAKVSDRDGVPKLLVESVEPLPGPAARAGDVGLTLSLDRPPAPETVERIKGALLRHRGATPFFIDVQLADGRRQRMRADVLVQRSSGLEADLAAALGVTRLSLR